MTNSIPLQIKKRIHHKGPGWCFTVHDFIDLGNYHAVRRALARLAQTGKINRVSEGIYNSPRYHDTLGALPVEIDSLIDAMQRAHQIRCQPSGAYAANLLGLSEQVPAKITILTDGPSKKIKVNNREIQFKRTTPKNMATAGTISGLVIQAIKYIGQTHITDKHFQILKNRLTKEDITNLQKSAHLAPAWIARLIKTELIGD